MVLIRISWSGAFGKECLAGPNAKCEKIISDFWAIEADVSTNCYPGGELDVINKGRDFCMNFVNEKTCPSYTNWGIVEALDTLSPPQLDSASFFGDNFTIIVSQPMVNGRADGAAFLNNDVLDSTHDYCVYPISDYIFKETDGCRDIWRFGIIIIEILNTK